MVFQVSRNYIIVDPLSESFKVTKLPGITLVNSVLVCLIKELPVFRRDRAGNYRIRCPKCNSTLKEHLRGQIAFLHMLVLLPLIIAWFSAFQWVVMCWLMNKAGK